MYGMAVHAVEGDSEDYQKFRDDFERIQAEATRSTSAKELLVAAGAANQALGDYGYRTTRFIRQQGALLQNMISMLTQTLVSIGAGSEQSADYLLEIERELARAVVLEDVQELKLRLGACLDKLQDEAARQKAETEANASQIREQVERAQKCIRETVASTDQLDLVTGLPTQPAAKAALEEALTTPEQRYVAIVVVNRIHSINSRFGYAVGDLVLKLILEQLRQKLSVADRLFRWSGPAFVALLEREESIGAVRTEIARITSKNLEKIFEVGGRPVLLPVTASWLVIPLTQPSMKVNKTIEKFIASHTENGNQL